MTQFPLLCYRLQHPVVLFPAPCPRLWLSEPTLSLSSASTPNLIAAEFHSLGSGLGERDGHLDCHQLSQFPSRLSPLNCHYFSPPPVSSPALLISASSLPLSSMSSLPSVPHQGPAMSIPLCCRHLKRAHL